MLGINRSASATGNAVAYFDDYRVSKEFFSDPPPFVANFESGDLTEWVHAQAIPGRITVQGSVKAQGSYAGRFEVQEGDVEPETGGSRAELISGREFEAGDDEYFRILARVDSWDFNQWGLIWQLHDQSNEPPMLSLNLGEVGTTKELALTTQGEHRYWQAPLPSLGQWFEVVVHVVFGTKGSVEVWYEGEQQKLDNGKTVEAGIDTLGEAPDFDRLGVYRSKEATGTAVVYHDDYRITPAFFSEPP